MKLSKANVVVAIPTNGNDGREQMSGVFDYVSRHTSWSIQLVNTRTDIANGVLEAALKNANGVLLSIAYGITEMADKMLCEYPKLKFVVTNDHLVPLYEKSGNCRALLLDNELIGRDAARYLVSLGRFASYGFVHGAMRYPWSIEREVGFRSALPAKAPIFAFTGNTQGAVPDDAVNPVISPGEIGAWLERLPKPAAVFGANDLFARMALTVCEQLGIAVPHDVAVVGCDNDPLVWGSARPPLSSFQLPFRELGYKAAQTLDRLLQGRKPPLRTIRVAGTHLFERASSTRIPPATALVEKARAYIAKHACDGIRVGDVVSYLGVSRSLLDIRFRQVCGKSVLEDILDIRLAEVRHQLARTNRTILQIGRSCGFNDPDHLKRTFKARYGMAMRDWRMKNSQRSRSM